MKQILGDRTILTTTEWNNLQTNGVSFQVKVEANEGIWVKGPICKRVTDAASLHTETCSQTSGFCYADGYTGNNTTITYGSLGTAGTLESGDAFDCDVNGNGNVDVDSNNDSIERFYYVSPRWTPGTTMTDDTYDSNYAVLIYYKNFYNGEPSDSGAAYHTSDYNYLGPAEALIHLPTTSYWSNISLKETERRIVGSSTASVTSSTTLQAATNGGTLPTAFSYTGKAARLLTLPELYKAGCYTDGNVTTLGTTGVLKSCNYIMEGTKYANNSKATYGPWLETPFSSSSYNVFEAFSNDRHVYNVSASYTNNGVRPVIEIPISKLEY